MSDDRFVRYRDDPCAFVCEVLGVHLYSRQREIIEGVRDHERVACKAGNAVGKTVAAACLILAWLAGGPGSVVVSTSATEAQLRRVLWRETRRRFKQARGFFDGAVLTETEIRLRDDWFAIGFSTDTPEAMQGTTRNASSSSQMRLPAWRNRSSTPSRACSRVVTLVSC